MMRMMIIMRLCGVAAYVSVVSGCCFIFVLKLMRLFVVSVVSACVILLFCGVVFFSLELFVYHHSSCDCTL
jgi:hypothetical protein